MPRARRSTHSPLRVARSIASVFFAATSMSMTACSATASEFEPGAWTTGMPSRVAAGRSTVSSPTPWRPMTFSCLQADIRRSLQFGRMRNRMPSAARAAAITPSSVRSGQTVTRASVSSSVCPSG